MKKLFKENIRNVGENWKFVLGYTIVMGVLLVATDDSGVGFGAALFGIIWFDIDESASKKSDWKSYLAMLPISTKDIIVDKYVRLIGYNTIGITIWFLLILTREIFNGGDAGVQGLSILWIDGISVVMLLQMSLSATLVPAYIRFGEQDGVLLAFVSLGICTAALLPLYFLLFESAGIIGKAIIALILLVVAYSISYKVSMKCYREEFECEKGKEKGGKK